MSNTKTARNTETVACPKCGGTGDTCSSHTDQQEMCARCGGWGELAMYELTESELETESEIAE